MSLDPRKNEGQLALRLRLDHKHYVYMRGPFECRLRSNYSLVSTQLFKSSSSFKRAPVDSVWECAGKVTSDWLGWGEKFFLLLKPLYKDSE